ncbi:MAG: hypothetical protein ABSC63_04665 [Candidatus Binataceae bacterium]
MRTIIRFSLDDDYSSALGQKLTKIPVDAGFAHQPNTATYERTDMRVSDLGQVMQSFWNAASAHPGPGVFDHFWMYSDRQVSN